MASLKSWPTAAPKRSPRRAPGRSGSLGWARRGIGLRLFAERAVRRLAVMSLAVSSSCSVGGCQRLGADTGGAASERGTSSHRAGGSPGTAGRAPGSSERWAPYPPGRWRLEPPAALAPAVIWVSHILVRHARAADEESFSFANWKSVAPPATRSREEALARARDIAEAAKQRPERFAELASLYSEDITNREHGGSLGGLRASQLLFWPQVLDAFAALRPGEVSDPVETRFGFHIFLRQPAPAEQTVSGRHIVISHDRTLWSRMATCKDELPPRTREQALQLATEIFQRLQAHPESFADAVQRYSDDCDAAVGGDFGSWSSREVAPFERRLEVLRSLAVGEVAPPRETHVGFEIIVRTPERPRQRLAARLLSINFDPWVAESDPKSRQGALRTALEAARELEAHPARLEELQSRYCCAGPAVWKEGREPPSLGAVLAALKPGEIASRPLRVPGAYVVAQKLDPAEVALPARPLAELELPSAEHVTLQSLLGLLSFDAAHEALSRLSRESAGALGLSSAVESELGAELANWAMASNTLMPKQRAVQLELALQQARTLLTDDLYARYRTALEEGLTESVLSQRKPMF